MEETRSAVTFNFSNLPTEVFLIIFEYLSLEEQVRCVNVSARWRDLIENYLLRVRREVKLEESAVSPGAEAWRRYLVTREGFAHVLRCCGPNLRSLDLLAGRDEIDLEEMGFVDAVTTFCHQLHTLKLYGEVRAVDFHRLTASLGSNLQTLVMDGLGDEMVSILFTNCRRLRKLDVSWSENLTADAFLNTPHSLKRLDISYCDKLRDKCLKHMSANCKDSLEELNAEGCDRFKPNCVDAIVEFPNLSVLNLSAYKLLCDRNESPRLGALSGLTKLERLRLSYRCIEDDDLSALVRGCRRLKSLNLARDAACPNHRINEVGFACLSEARALQDLDVSGQRGFSDDSLLTVAHLPHLTHLRLRKCPNVSNGGLKAVAPLAQRLEYLDASHNDSIDDIGVLEAFHEFMVGDGKIKINLSWTTVAMRIRHNFAEQPKFHNIEYEVN